MTTSEDELKRIEDEGCGCAIKGPDCCVEALVAEVRRLRAALVKAHEHAGCGDAPGSSPECCGICAALADDE